MTTSFLERFLTFEFQLGKGSFGTSGSDVVTLEGYRSDVRIIKVGSFGDYQAEIRIYGVDISIMNRLNTLGNQYYTQSYRFNTVAVTASDSSGAKSLVHTGDIFNCWIDFNSAPDVALVINSAAQFLLRLIPLPPSSYGQPTDVAVIISNIAKQAGIAFENNGVSAILSYPYFAGSVMQQIDRAARAAKINYSVNGPTGPLVIWPKNGIAGPKQSKYRVFSVGTGMIGYPAYTQLGIHVRSVFTPGQDPQIGEIINVESSLKPATGSWVPIQIDYNLQSITPGGQWEIEMHCAAPPNAPNALAQAAGAAG